MYVVCMFGQPMVGFLVLCSCVGVGVSFGFFDSDQIAVAKSLSHSLSLTHSGNGAGGDTGNNSGNQIEVLREHFEKLKKLEQQYHDVCKQYTTSVMENKKLRRQLDAKDKSIDELKAAVVEKTGA